MDKLPQSVNEIAHYTSRALVYRMNLPPYVPEGFTSMLVEALASPIKLCLHDREYVRWLLYSGVLPARLSTSLQRDHVCARCQLAPRLDDNTLCLQCLEEDDRG